MSSKAYKDYVIARAWPGGPTYNDLDNAEKRIINRIVRDMNHLDMMAAVDPRLHSHHRTTHITVRQGMHGRQNFTNTSHSKEKRNPEKKNSKK